MTRENLEALGRARLVLGLLLVVRDVEELDLVALLGGGDDTQPVTQLLLAQVLLGQVLEVALREGNVGVDPDLALTCVPIQSSAQNALHKTQKGRYRGRESFSQPSPTRVRHATFQETSAKKAVATGRVRRLSGCDRR